jgi:hypothetical protein
VKLPRPDKNNEEEEVIRRKLLLAQKELQPADPRICPLCFKRLDQKAEFHWFCPKCDGFGTVGIKGIECKSPGCRGARKSFRDQPFLAHKGCSRKNPLFKAESTRRLILEEGSFEWFDAVRNDRSRVSHWTLPVICNAQARFPGVDAAWFPQRLLLDVRDGKATRVLLRGSKSVGKSVLASVAISDMVSPVDGVENYVYATPSSDEDQPFSFYASVLQDLRDLNSRQPLYIAATDIATRTIIRAGFYPEGVGEEPSRCLVFYDLSGELYIHGTADRVREHTHAADVVYVVIDITHLSSFRNYTRSTPSDEDLAKAAGGLLAVDQSLDFRKKVRTIPIVTKSDLLELEKDSCLKEIEDNERLSPAQKRGFQRLRELAKAPASHSGQGALNNLAWNYLEILKDLLNSESEHERQIQKKLESMTGAFFVGIRGIPPAPPPRPIESKGVRQMVKSTPIVPFGISELAAYTVMISNF